jgi:hypothetical protein
MIIDIPTSEDFYNSGKELLDFAWDTVVGLLSDIDNLENYGFEPDEAEEISDEYWKSAKRRLTTALSITQQGVEFILKGKITDISAFILIAGDPGKWPSPYGADLKFSQFRMLDAQDLIRVHDTVAITPLPPEFVEAFNLLREKRNSIMHSIDKSANVSISEVLDSILFMHKSLFPNETWGQVRSQFISNYPISGLEEDYICYVSATVCGEISSVFKLLTPAKVKTYFGVDKKQRLYFCPECHSSTSRDLGLGSKLAVLNPKGPNSTKIYCPVCNSEYDVVRTDCKDSDCPGNVISQEHEICLTCGG